MSYIIKKLKPRKRKQKRMRVLKLRSVQTKPISQFLMKVSSIRCYVSSCRAVLLPRFGGPEVLEHRTDVPVPDLKPNEVLVRARAVSINLLDARMRSGYGRSIFEPLLPLILGRDISGEIAAIGASLKSLTVGQEVFGAPHPTAVRGTYADYAILSEDELSPKPASVNHAPLGGGGAVGFAAIQLAVAAGCHVTTTCGNQSINRVKAAGAEQAVDYSAEDIEAIIRGNFGVILDAIGVTETERIGINLLNRGGHYITLQGEAAALSDRYGLPLGLPVATAVLPKKKDSIQIFSWHGADSEGLHEIRQLSEAGKLNIPVEKNIFHK